MHQKPQADVEFATGGMFRPGYHEPAIDTTVQRYGARWEEGKHPRADDGKFGSGGGGSEKGKPAQAKLPLSDTPEEAGKPPREPQAALAAAPPERLPNSPGDEFLKNSMRKREEAESGTSYDSMPKFAKGGSWAAASSRGAIAQSKAADETNMWQIHRKAAGAHDVARIRHEEGGSPEGAAWHTQERDRHKAQEARLYDGQEIDPAAPPAQDEPEGPPRKMLSDDPKFLKWAKEKDSQRPGVSDEEWRRRGLPPRKAAPVTQAPIPTRKQPI